MKGAMENIRAYRLVRRLTQDYTEMEAYRVGLIDQNGEFIKNMEDLPEDDQERVSRMDLLIIRLKRALRYTPTGLTLKSLTTALWLLREDIEDGYVDEHDVINLQEEVAAKSFSDLKEEIATSYSGGAADPTTVKNYAPKKKKYGRCRVYEVDHETFCNIRNEKHQRHKFSKYIKDEDTRAEIQDYARKKPKRSIMIQNSKTGEYRVLKRGKDGVF